MRIFQLLSSCDLEQIIRFVVVGFSNFAISFTVFYVCYKYLQLTSLLLNETGNFGSTINNLVIEMGMRPPEAFLANIIAYTCGIVNSFCWNRIWTFKISTKTTKRFKQFIILNVFCLILSTIIILIFVDVLNWPYKMIWFTTMVFVTVLNYFGCKYWVFNPGSIQYTTSL